MKKRVISLFAIYAVAGFGVLSAAYLFVKVTTLALYNESEVVFGSLFRMHKYHEQHPYQYLLLISLVYGCLATAWAYYKGKSQKGWKRAASIVGVMLLTVLLSSVPGGLLWVLHDVQAGYFPGMRLFRRALRWGAIAGFQVGWIVFLLSMPYNVICLFCGYWLTNSVEKRLRYRSGALIKE